LGGKRRFRPHHQPAFAFVLAFLSVIPAGNLLFTVALALAFLSVIPAGNLLFTVAFALAFLSVIPAGNPLFRATEFRAPSIRAASSREGVGTDKAHASFAFAFLSVIPAGNLLSLLPLLLPFFLSFPQGIRFSAPPNSVPHPIAQPRRAIGWETTIPAPPPTRFCFCSCLSFCHSRRESAFREFIRESHQRRNHLPATAP